MPIKLILLFAITEFVVSLTPGPAVFLVVSQGMRAGFRPSLRGILGIETGNTIFFVLSALGLGAVLAASANLFQAVKWVGAAYLIVAGLKMIFSKGAVLEHRDSRVNSKRSFALFAQGLLTQLVNPKALIFYSALLPQFITPGGPVVKQFVTLGVVSMCVEVPILMGYGWLAERGMTLLPKKFAALPERIAGVCLVGAGAGLASMRKL
jgi:homoserine/homoserine lactone efflux protein